MFKGKKILITGGTGSLGKALAKKLLELDADIVRIFSRNENNQTTMESEFDDDRLRYFIGDVRDLPRLIKAMEDVDIVFHAAALKHVPVIEYNSFEAIKTNVVGSQNVIDAALIQNVEKVICIGTDKAVSPLNTYGATKLLMEKLFISANNYINREKFMKKMYEKGIETGIHYNPVHKMSHYKSKIKLPITEQVANEIVSIPTHPNLTNSEVDKIIHAVNNLYDS